MQAHEARIHLGAETVDYASVRGKLVVLHTSELRDGHVPRYPGLAKYLGQIEELEMKTKREIINELVPIMFGDA